MPLTSQGEQMLADAIIGGTSFAKLTSSTAYIGVGDGTAAFAKTQTDLQGTNKLRKVVDSGYPQRSGNQLTFRATFNTSEANFAWNEFGLFNASPGGQMFARWLQSAGTKSSGAVWVATITITITGT
jgi:hypothetical protein